MTIYKHEQIISDASVDESIDIEKFLEKKHTYPEDLQKALDGMVKQNIYLTSIPNWAALFPKYGKNEFSAQVRASLHEDVGGYITLLESEPFHYYPGLAYSIDESVDFMIEMEKTLLTSQIYNIDSSYLSSTYISLLNELIIGSEQGRIVGRDGKVKKNTKWLGKNCFNRRRFTFGFYYAKSC